MVILNITKKNLFKVNAIKMNYISFLTETSDVKLRQDNLLLGHITTTKQFYAS